MSVLYLMTAPPPAVRGTDAVVQEAELLRSRFGGEIIFLPPGRRPNPWIPRALYGLHRLRALRRLERDVDVHHIFHAELYRFPVLRLLNKPIVYTVVSGLDAKRRLPDADALGRLHGVVVTNAADRERLERHGIANVRALRPGIDLSRYHYTAGTRVSPTSELVLLAGSSPWTRKQFRTKGVDALLRVAKKMPYLRLVFLWRGVLSREMRDRVAEAELTDRVEILDEWTDVNQLLRRVHAAVVLADKPKLVKAYPHSLLEALACGRPVLVSNCIAMAEYVQSEECGLVVRGVEESDLRDKIQLLRQGYDAYLERAADRGKDFSQESVVKAYGDLYASAIR